MGEHIVSQCDFTNPFIINELSTAVLERDEEFKGTGMDLFQAVQKIDWYDPYKYVKGARAIFHNWENFVDMFELRNRFIHELRNTNVPYSKLGSLCDNTMNFIDAAVFVFLKETRNSVIGILKSDYSLRGKKLTKSGVVQYI